MQLVALFLFLHTAPTNNSRVNGKSEISKDLATMANLRFHTNNEHLKKELRFRGGDVIIALGPNDDDHLLLHSSVLKASSPVFAAGLKAAQDLAKAVNDPITGDVFKIVKYHLVLHDNVFSLQVKYHNGDAESDDLITATLVDSLADSAQEVHLSEYGEGLVERRTPGQYYTNTKYTAWDSAYEHEALFLMLYKVAIDQFLELPLTYKNIANIVAYAQMYDILPLVAAPLEEWLLARDDIWADIRDDAIFHLAIAKKIRSVPLFVDALRHFIGSGADWEVLYEQVGYTEAEAALLVLPKRQELAELTGELVRKFQRLGLTPYIGHRDKASPDPEVGSTFLATGFDRKAPIEKANFLARAIFNEFVIQHLAGEAHWSHVRQIDRQYASAEFTPAGLRLLCNAIVEACRCGRETELFDRDAARKFTAIFNFDVDTRHEITTQISDALRLLVLYAGTYARPLITPPPSDQIPEDRQVFRNGSRASSPSPDDPPRRRSGAVRGGRGGRGRGRGGRGRDIWAMAPRSVDNTYGVSKGGLKGTMTSWIAGMQCARNDEGCAYFTCMELSEESLPWEGKTKEEWKGYNIDGLEDASDDWIQAVFGAFNG